MTGQAIAMAVAAERPHEDVSTRLNALFDAHHQRLYRLARRLSGCSEDARDLVQETFLRAARSPHSVPAGATSVPVLVLLDGREVRTGVLQSRLNAIVPERFADGPAHVSAGEFGERRTRAYLVEGTRFYVVFERIERSGPMRVTGVFLP